MKFSINVKIYLKSGKYLGRGKIVREDYADYVYNVLHNIGGHLYGHLENKKETGFEYGCGFIHKTMRPGNLSPVESIKFINAHTNRYFFILKNTNYFEEIKL